LDDLLRPFHEAEKPRSHFRIGTEMEKIGVLLPEGSPLPYEGERSIKAVFDRLVSHHGWFEEREHPGGQVISLRRGATSITLEPGGQFELSGAPHETVHQTCAEFRGHMHELADISAELRIAWLGVGFHPFARREDLPWVPKLRYGIMKEYLPTRGSMALDMMLRTATVQANLDFESEADAMRKLRLSLAVSPIVSAMFANSPFVEGQLSGDKSRRVRVWLSMDPDRSGLLPFAWSEEATYRDYVEWALDVPMFLVKRDGKILANTGQTFRQFMKDGFEGAVATHGDWEIHLNTLFPESRLKKTLEVRGADSQDQSLICALPALWKGLLYDDESLDALERLVSPLDHDLVDGARLAIAEHALGARLAGRPVREWATELLDVSESGLARLSNLNKNGDDERIHLRKLHTLVNDGKCPADLLIDEASQNTSFTEAVLTHARV
jgi:glutamate--cysteine ligase